MLEREPDAAAMADFYASRLGEVARRVILARLQSFWPDLSGCRLLGFGYAVPYLGAFGAERAIVAGTAALGVPSWPEGRCASLVCDEEALPFAEALFDRVLIVHGLERAEALRPLLRQLWRVMAPEGRLLVVAPNRASLWAQVETTPFGQGRPFSRRQLDQLLRDALFEPERWDRALYAPPLAALVGNGRGWEHGGALLFPALGGLHLVEARKSIYALTPRPADALTAPLFNPDSPSPA